MHLFHGKGTLILDKMTVTSQNGEYGAMINDFYGTLVLTNGTTYSTTPNGNQSRVLGSGPVVFAGSTVTINGSNPHVYNTAYSIVAGTTNTYNSQSLDLSKVTVNGDLTALDTETTYSVMKSDKAFGSVPANTNSLVAANLLQACWIANLVDNEDGTHEIQLKNVVPAAMNGTTRYETVQAALDDYTEGAIIVYESASIHAPDGQESLTVNIELKNGAELTLTQSPLYTGTMTLDATAGTVTFTSTRHAATFTWTGSSSSDWQTASNWKVGEATVAECPGSTDSVVVPSGLTDAAINVSDNATVQSVELNSDVTFSAGNGKTLNVKTITGAGKLKVTYWMRIGSVGDGTWSCPIDVAEGKTLRVESNGTLTLSGKVTGKGTVYLYQNGFWLVHNLTGDWADFEGVVQQYDNSSGGRGRTQFVPQATSAKALYEDFEDNEKSDEEGPKESGTYNFGAFAATSSHDRGGLDVHHSGVTLSIGARDDVPSFYRGVMQSDTIIEKVGTNSLDSTATPAKYVLKGGLLILPSTYDSTKVESGVAGYKVSVSADTPTGKTTYALYRAGLMIIVR